MTIHHCEIERDIHLVENILSIAANLWQFIAKPLVTWRCVTCEVDGGASAGGVSAAWGCSVVQQGQSTVSVAPEGGQCQRSATDR